MSLTSFIATRSEYKIIGFSQNENKHKIYWAELLSWFPPFGKRVFNFIEEKDSEILNETEKAYSKKIIVVTNKCPACHSEITSNDTQCKNCGLNLVALY